MAYLPPGKVEVIIRERGLPRLCANTITSEEELKAELVKVRERGYARSYQETDRGAWGMATPIRDWQGEVVAAIGIAGPTSRFGEEVAEAYVDRCRQAADRISSSLLARPLSDDEVTASGQAERHEHVTPDVMGEET